MNNLLQKKTNKLSAMILKSNLCFETIADGIIVYLNHTYMKGSSQSSAIGTLASQGS